MKGFILIYSPDQLICDSGMIGAGELKGIPQQIHYYSSKKRWLAVIEELINTPTITNDHIIVNMEDGVNGIGRFSNLKAMFQLEKLENKGN